VRASLDQPRHCDGACDGTKFAQSPSDLVALPPGSVASTAQQSYRNGQSTPKSLAVSTARRNDHDHAGK
jgi:hypothetical protein